MAVALAARGRRPTADGSGDLALQGRGRRGADPAATSVRSRRSRRRTSDSRSVQAAVGRRRPDALDLADPALPARPAQRSAAPPAAATLDFFNRSRLGDLMSRVAGDVSAIESFLVSGTSPRHCTYAPVSWSSSRQRCSGSTRHWRSSRSSWRRCSGSPHVSSPGASRRSRGRSSAARGSISTSIEQTLSTMPLVHAFDAGEREVDRYREEAEAKYRAEMASARLRSWLRPDARDDRAPRRAGRDRRRRLAARQGTVDRRRAARLPHVPQSPLRPGPRASAAPSRRRTPRPRAPSAFSSCSRSETMPADRPGAVTLERPRGHGGGRARGLHLRRPARARAGRRFPHAAARRA